MEIYLITHLPQNNTTGMGGVHLQYHQCHLEQFFCLRECEPIFAQSYINAYNTGFNQPNRNYQKALNNYNLFTPNDTDSNFIPGTFGYGEQYNSLSQSITIDYLQDANYYDGNPYLFISAGSGGGSGFMYLDWIIVTYGVPYVIGIS